MTQAEFTRLKSALTRAKKKGPEAVILACDAAFKSFDENGYPDDWHRWNIARMDAEMEMRRRNW